MPGLAQGLRFDFEWRTTVFTVLMLPALFWLGLWQLQRADEKASIAASWEQRQSQPPLPLAQVWSEAAANLAYVPVKLAGVFLPDKYFLLDNRIHNGRFGYEVLAVVQLAGDDRLVLVNRGWMAADPARLELPEVPTVVGKVDLIGHVYVAPGAPYLLAEQQLGKDWPQMLQAVEMEKILPILQGINGKQAFALPIRISAGEPGALTVDWQLVNVSPDKHRAYALQWFAMALVLLVFFVLRSSNLWQWLKPSTKDARVS